METCESTSRWLAFLVRDEDGELQWTSRREGEDDVHDVTEVLATVDVTIYENNPAYVRFLERFTGEEVPVDDNGCVDPNWAVEGDVLVEAKEEAWDFHSTTMLDEWVDQVMIQIKATTAFKD